MRKSSASPCVLVFLLVASLYVGVFSRLVAVGAAETEVFGCVTIGGSNRFFWGTKDASRFLLGEKGTIESITVYFANSGFSAKAAIYADLNGAPSVLIAQSSSQNVSQSGWKTFTVLQRILAPGYYWLSVVCNKWNAMGAMAPASAIEHAKKFALYLFEFTSDFGTPSGYDAFTTSIYATYTPAASPTPAPTPTPTSTPTATPAPGIAVKVYYDQACTKPAASIDWGTLTVGGAKNLTIYVRNEGSVPVTLEKSVTWYKGNSTYITLGWDYGGQTLTTSSVMKLVLKLAVAPHIPASLTNFNFDLTITATG